MSLASVSAGVTAAAAAKKDSAPSARRYERIDALIQREFNKSRESALTIGIVENGRLAWTKSYGVADAATGRRADEHAIYPVASVTKIVTGLMLLQLVERGVVHLTDPVERYVPEIREMPNRFPWAPPVTLMQLATMTSGIPDTAARNCVNDPALVLWDQCLIAHFSIGKYSYEPGTRREYSNIGYAILGLALSRAAHRPYAEYVVSEIFKPLGMNDSTFSIDASGAERFVYAEPGMPRLPSYERDFLLPAAGVFTTLEDLAKLMRFQLGLDAGSVLTKDALEASYRMVVPSDGNLRYGDGVGFSAVRNPDGDLVALGHGGHSRYIASYEFDRTRQSGVIVLTTDRNGAYKPLVRNALKILYPDSTGGTAQAPTEEH